MPSPRIIGKKLLKEVADDYSSDVSHGLIYLSKKHGFSSSHLERCLKDAGYTLRKKGWNGFKKGSLNPSADPVRKRQLSEQQKGKIIPLAQRRKISQTMKERLKDPILKQKWVDNATGREVSLATRRKISQAHQLRPKTTKQLKAKLDIVFAKFIRFRDSKDIGEARVGYCVTCNKSVLVGGLGGGQAGHFMSRRHNGTRYDEKNVHLQCVHCNIYGSGQQYMYSLFLDSKYGKGTADLLHAKAYAYHKFTAFELEFLLEDYKQRLKGVL